MKRNVLTFSMALIILSLVACNTIKNDKLESAPLIASINKAVPGEVTVMEKDEKRIFSDFIYEVAPRFNAIKKSDINKARSFTDFIDEHHAQQIVVFKSLSVIILDGQEPTDVTESSTNGTFTPAQLGLLQGADYSTNILIQAVYQLKSEDSGQLGPNYETPYLTVVPETQATYKEGKKALKEFLKVNSKEAREGVDPQKLKPAKLFFTVTKSGSIENAKFDRSSGYPAIDQLMIELISETSGKWESGENVEGEKVNQELVVSFGLMGC